jgi:hypothetical protein
MFGFLALAQDQLVSAAKLAGLVNVTSLSTPASDDDKQTVLEYLRRVRTDLPSTAEAIIDDLEFAEACCATHSLPFWRLLCAGVTGAGSLNDCVGPVPTQRCNCCMRGAVDSREQARVRGGCVSGAASVVREEER